MKTGQICATSDCCSVQHKATTGKANSNSIDNKNIHRGRGVFARPVISDHMPPRAAPLSMSSAARAAFWTPSLSSSSDRPFSATASLRAPISASISPCTDRSRCSQKGHDSAKDKRKPMIHKAFCDDQKTERGCGLRKNTHLVILSMFWISVA
jgi:hypothetical protein